MMVVVVWRMERRPPPNSSRDGMDAGFPDLAPTLLILIQEESTARQRSNCRSDPQGRLVA